MQGCTVTAVHPASGRIVSLAVPERNEVDAKRHAEECGLRHVVVTRRPRARAPRDAGALRAGR